MIGATIDPALIELKASALEIWKHDDLDPAGFDPVWQRFIFYLANRRVKARLAGLDYRPDPVELFVEYVNLKLWEIY